MKSVEELLKNLSPEEVKAVIDQVKNPKPGLNVHEHKWGTKHVKIALIGDTHIGSKFSNYDVLADLFRRFKIEGVDAVYHTGDITEGYGMRQGHSFEVDMHGADEQVKGVVERMPKIDKPIYFITGNHDASHYRSAGVDIGKAISKERKDLVYLGSEQARIVLGKGTDLMLMHPGSGSAYAISYKPQKIIESLEGGTKPNILAIGHFHKIEFLNYRNVNCFQTGTTQNQTDFQKRMNLSAHLGGWVLDVYMTDKGSIDRLDMKLFPYY